MKVRRQRDFVLKFTSVGFNARWLLFSSIKKVWLHFLTYSAQKGDQFLAPRPNFRGYMRTPKGCVFAFCEGQEARMSTDSLKFLRNARVLGRLSIPHCCPPNSKSMPRYLTSKEMEKRKIWTKLVIKIPPSQVLHKEEKVWRSPLSNYTLRLTKFQNPLEKHRHFIFLKNWTA